MRILREHPNFPPRLDEPNSIRYHSDSRDPTGQAYKRYVGSNPTNSFGGHSQVDKATVSGTVMKTTLPKLARRLSPAGGLQTAGLYPPAYPPDSRWILISPTGPDYTGSRKELNLCHFVNNT